MVKRRKCYTLKKNAVMTPTQTIMHDFCMGNQKYHTILEILFHSREDPCEGKFEKHQREQVRKVNNSILFRGAHP